MTLLHIERVVLGFDPTGENRPALQVAARMALHWHARLHGVFVEDMGLLDAAALPISREILSPVGLSTPLDVEQVIVQIKALASRTRDWLAAESSTLGLEWSFEVTRGRLSPELFPSEGTDFLILEGTSRPFADGVHLRSRWSVALRSVNRPVMLFRRAPPAARSVAALVNLESDKSRYVLDIAEQFAKQRGGSLIVLVQDTPQSKSTSTLEALAEFGIGTKPTHIELAPHEPKELYQRVSDLGCGLIVISSKEPCLGLLLDKVADNNCSLMILP